MEIHNLKELIKRKTLEYNDIVIFTVNKEEIKYNIHQTHLYNRSFINVIIFEILKLNKLKFVKTYYNYIHDINRKLTDNFWQNIGIKIIRQRQGQ